MIKKRINSNNYNKNKMIYKILWKKLNKIKIYDKI